MQKKLTKMFIMEKRSKPEILKALGLTSNQYRYLLEKYNLRRNPVRTTNWFNRDLKNLIDEEIYILGFWNYLYPKSFRSKDFFVLVSSFYHPFLIQSTMYCLSSSVTHHPTGIETTFPIILSKVGNDD